MSSKWTQKEREQAAIELWPGSNTAEGSPHLQYEWIEQALTASPRTHFYRMVEQRCEINSLREALKLAMVEVWEHSREYHHITKPEFFEKANAALEKSK